MVSPPSSRFSLPPRGPGRPDVDHDGHSEEEVVVPRAIARLQAPAPPASVPGPLIVAAVAAAGSAMALAGVAAVAALGLGVLLAGGAS